MDYCDFKNGYTIHKDNKWPSVFFHYSGINVQVNNGVMTFRHTMYLRDIVRKTFIEPYAKLLKKVFTEYLDTPIHEVEIVPLSKSNYSAKTVTYYLNKLFPLEWLIYQVMKVKYKESHKPYSEK